MIGRVLMLTMVLGLVGGGAAHALCNCTDIDGCSSAAACASSNPGDACSPPSGASCKAVKGNLGGLACCCGCSRGTGLTCVFTPVAEALVELGAATCGSETLEKATDKAVTKSSNKLLKAESKCSKGKTKGVPGKLKGAKKPLEKVEGKLDRLVEKGEIDQACADSYRALANEFLADIDDLGSTTPPDGSTTSTSIAAGSTTSTSMPSSDCIGTFSLFTDPNEVDIVITCPPGTYTGFTITPAQPRMITNFLSPVGFTCSVLAGGILDCPGPGTFSGGSPFDAGRIRTDPAPTAGMGGTMTVLQGTMEFGFPVTGP